MPSEAQARIAINRLLLEAGWRFAADERGNAANIVCEHRVAKRLLAHTLAHQALKAFVACLFAVEQRRVDRGQHFAQALRLLSVGEIPLGALDVLAVHRGHCLAAFAEARVALDAEQHEGRDDQDHQEAHEELLAIADEVEHAGYPVMAGANAGF